MLRRHTAVGGTNSDPGVAVGRHGPMVDPSGASNARLITMLGGTLAHADPPPLPNRLSRRYREGTCGWSLAPARGQGNRAWQDDHVLRTHQEARRQGTNPRAPG